MEWDWERLNKIIHEESEKQRIEQERLKRLSKKKNINFEELLESVGYHYDYLSNFQEFVSLHPGIN